MLCHHAIKSRLQSSGVAITDCVFYKVIIGSWECAECHQILFSWVGSGDKTINPEAVTDCLFCMT